MNWQRAALVFAAGVMILMMFVKGRHRGDHPPVTAFRSSAVPVGWLLMTGDVRFQGAYPLVDTKLANSVIIMSEPLCAIEHNQTTLETALRKQGAVILDVACQPGYAYGLATIQPLPADQRLVLLGTIPLNSATVDELGLVPGIGPVLAQRIVRHRQIYGDFKRFEELLQVKGVGEKKLAAFRQWLTI